LAARGVAKIAARFGIDRPLHNFRNRFAFCNLFDAVIVNSKKIIQTLSLTPGFDIKKCKLVYNGVAIPEISDAIRMKYRKELMLSDDEHCIMCIGRLSSQKGIDFALEAFTQTFKKIPNSRLVIVGSGSQRSEYENLAKELGIDSNINFTGHRDDTSGLLQAADLFWLTSRSEGMSNALLEAMAHAKATIAFDIAGVSEAIQHNVNGVIVAPEAVTQLANESIMLLDDSSRRERIGKNAREHVINNFAKEKSISSLECVLLELVGK
jgi:glycosyltransferase involved in cell wall biosynthesis